MRTICAALLFTSSLAAADGFVWSGDPFNGGTCVVAYGLDDCSDEAKGAEGGSCVENTLVFPVATDGDRLCEQGTCCPEFQYPRIRCGEACEGGVCASVDADCPGGGQVSSA